MNQLIIESACKSDAAILYDYDNDSNCKIEGYIGQQMWRSEEKVYQALNERHIMTDVLPHAQSLQAAQLKPYKIIFCVNAQMLDEEDIARLTAYVEEGGILVLGPRCGYKSRENKARMLPFPGLLRELAGIEVRDFTMLDESDKVEVRFESNGKATGTVTFNEMLALTAANAEIVARYTSDYYAHETAISKVSVGKGKVIYCGTMPTVEITDLILEDLGIEGDLSDWVEVPKEIEVVKRAHHSGDIYIFMNYMNKPVNVYFKQSVNELISGSLLTGAFGLQPFAVHLIQKNKFN
ncbi:beta-galactosidase trimerization domain-containing protein [Cohnella yongneupensis]|uniref:Beta-galactosidase trimerization domain-containing protein n=1 Tax=Cohnella yongneupensis TaxID=425006 RepID=A0ABW0R2I3_9BACL